MLAGILILVVRVLVGASPRWIGSAPSEAQRIYFANHSSHIDTIALWASLPPDLRAKTRPVAAADYWNKGGFKTYLAVRALNAVFIDRSRSDANADPLQPLADALEKGYSLILFPEGTRSSQPLPSRFKSGLFRLAQRFPHVELVPVYLENLNRSMPKGALLPVPLICTVRFGSAIPHVEDEEMGTFLERARQAVVDLA